jgi:hypothetical protein
MYDGDVVLATAQAGLVDPHDLHALEALLGPRLVDEDSMSRHSCLSLQRSRAVAWRNGSWRHRASARASNAAMKPEPGRAQGTLSWVVLPKPPLATRGKSACSQASNWKKSRCRHLRRSRSWTSEFDTKRAFQSLLRSRTQRNQ